MRAALVERLDGPAAVSVGEVPEPQPGRDQVLIEVHAAGVTFPDVLLTRGRYQYRPDPPFVLGQQAAGVVRWAPPGAHVRPGDRVATLAEGSFADLVLADVGRVFPLPDQLDFAAAAIVSMNYLTAHFAFTERARLRSGETVLVHGAGGGLGSVAIQYGRALGARMIAVVSSKAKGDLAVAMGAHDVIAADGFRASVRDLTGGRGVDVVFDPVGGDRITDSLRSLAVGGRLLVVGFTAGEIPTVKVNRLLLSNTEVVGVGWGSYAETRVDYLQQQWSEVRPLIESGLLTPVVSATYPLSAVAAAVASLEERRAVGNVVVSVAG